MNTSIESTQHIFAGEIHAGMAAKMHFKGQTFYHLYNAHKNSSKLKTHSTALKPLHGWLMTNSNSSAKCSTIIDELNNYLPFSFTELHLAFALFSTLQLDLKRRSFFIKRIFCADHSLKKEENARECILAVALWLYKSGSTS